MNKSKTWIFIAVIVLVFFLFNPFKSLQNRDVGRPRVSEESVKPLIEYINSNYRTPSAYIIDSFEDHQIVMLGEMGRVSEQVRFAASLIPKLYKAGVYNIGIEYALYEDQDKLDRLLTASSFNENLAEEIYFNWLVLWGYEEYIELLRNAWRLNSSLAEDQTPFRIVGLNVKQHYEYIQTEEDVENQEKLAQVLREGIPDIFMAETIEKEFIDPGLKALIFGNYQRTVTKYRSKLYEENMEQSGFSKNDRMGNIVYKKIGNKAFSVFLHSPWTNRGSQTGLAYPVDGILDTLLERLPEDKQEAGFDVVDTVFAKIPIKTGDFTYGYEEVFFKDVCDGYVILGPISAYSAAAPISDFIHAGNIQAARENFPGPKEENLSTEQLNDYIARIAQNVQDSLDRMQ